MYRDTIEAIRKRKESRINMNMNMHKSGAYIYGSERGLQCDGGMARQQQIDLKRDIPHQSSSTNPSFK